MSIQVLLDFCSVNIGTPFLPHNLSCQSQSPISTGGLYNIIDKSILLLY